MPLSKPKPWVCTITAKKGSVSTGKFHSNLVIGEVEINNSMMQSYMPCALIIYMHFLEFYLFIHTMSRIVLCGVLTVFVGDGS